MDLINLYKLLYLPLLASKAMSGLQQHLQKKGYIFDCSIEANNKKEALTFVSSSKI